MSYITSADMAVVQSSVSTHARFAPKLPGASPVGPALEIFLMVVTSAAVSLVFCTAVAGALLH
jgi:hypothetical protein